MELRLLSAGKLLHHFHSKSLWSYLCMCYTGRWAWSLSVFFLGGQMIGIDLLSSCIDFNDKAATVSESSCSTAWAPKPCFWRSYQRSMLELLLPPLCKDVMLPRSVIRPLISPFLGESAVFLNISSQCHPIFLCYFPLLLLYICIYIHLVSATINNKPAFSST